MTLRIHRETRVGGVLMGIGGISPGSLLLILLIVLVLFGTKKLRHLGEDLGQAVRSFRRGMNEAEQEKPSLDVDKK